MKQLFLTLGILISVSFSGNTQNAYNINSYQAGEELKYILSYGFIRGGEAGIKVKDYNTDSSVMHHIHLYAKTLGLLDRVYKVYDVIESTYHPTTFLPTVASQNISEGGFKRLYKYDYDHISREDSTIIQSLRKGERIMPKGIQDFLSALFYAREFHINENIQEGEIFKMNTYYNDKLFPLILRYKGRKTIKTPIGKVDCYAFMPVTEVGRTFKSKDALTIYFTADQNKIPVSFEFDMFFGSAKCELIEYKGLKNPFTSLTPKK